MSRESLLALAKEICEDIGLTPERTERILRNINEEYDWKEAGLLSQKLKEEKPQCPHRKGEEKTEKMIYAEAANGMTVRIPETQYPAWKKEQDKIRAGKSTPNREMQEQLLSLMEKE